MLIVMANLILPMIVYGMGLCINNKINKSRIYKNKFFWINLLEASAFINVICMMVRIACSMIIKKYSAYEVLKATFNEGVIYKYWLLEVVTTGLLIFLLLPLIGCRKKYCKYILCDYFKEKIIWSQQILYVVLSWTIAIIIYSCMTYGQSSLHSDTSTAFLLAREQIKNFCLLPKDWCYANGDIWLLSQNLIGIPITLIFHNQIVGRCLESLIIVFITLICISYHSKKIFQDKSFLIIIPLFCICLRNMLDLNLYQAAYTPQMLFITLSTAWFYLAMNSKKLKYFIYLFWLILFMTANGTRNIAEIVVPLIGTLCILFYLQFRNDKFKNYVKEIKNLLIYLCIIIVPTIFGSILYLWIYLNHYVINTINNTLVFVDSLASVWNNIILTIQNAISIFGYSGNAKVISLNGITNLISIAISILIVFIIPFLQIKKISQENKGEQYFIIFGIIHNMLMLFLIIFLGKTTDRYLLTSIFICILISGHYIYKYWLKDLNLLHTVTMGGIILTIFIESVNMLQMSNNWQDNLNIKLSTVEALENHGLKYGYATYWNAGVNTLNSDFKVQVNALSMANNVDGSMESLSPMYWLSSKEWYRSSSWDGPTFLLLTANENNIFQASTLPKILGATIDQFDIPRTGMYVYAYNYNIIDVLDGYVYYNYSLSNGSFLNNGEDIGGIRHINSGGISAGPYIRLQKGSYMVNILGNNLNLADVDCTYNNGKNKLKISNCQVTESEIKYNINVKQDCENVEARVFNNTKDNTDIMINKMIIKSIH